LRAIAEAATVRQQSVAAGADRDLAQSYLNFLLNRPPETTVEEAPESELDALTQAVRTLAAAAPAGTGRREELAALEAAVHAADAGERAARAAGGPTVSLAVESGIQGETYRVTHDSGFAQGSLVAELNVFDGNQNRARVREAVNTRRKIEDQQEEAGRQIELQQRDAACAWRRPSRCWRPPTCASPRLAVRSSWSPTASAKGLSTSSDSSTPGTP